MCKMRKYSRYVIKILLLCIVVYASAGCGKESEEDLVFKDASVKEDAVDGQENAEDYSGQNTEDKDADRITEEEKVQTLYVHVCGHVGHPGVYEFQAGSRVFEAIEAAGGMSETAAFSYLNQAELLEDGQQIYVPSQEEVESGKLSSGSHETEADQSGEEDGKVNLNTATKEELMTLNGIGDVRAQAILQYREEHGEFRSITELMEVEGIKKGTFQKLKDQIKI